MKDSKQNEVKNEKPEENAIVSKMSQSDGLKMVEPKLYYFEEQSTSADVILFLHLLWNQAVRNENERKGRQELGIFYHLDCRLYHVRFPLKLCLKKNYIVLILVSRDF